MGLLSDLSKFSEFVVDVFVVGVVALQFIDSLLTVNIDKIKMEYSKKIRKSGLFYYRRRRLEQKWEEENSTVAENRENQWNRNHQNQSQNLPECSLFQSQNVGNEDSCEVCSEYDQFSEEDEYHENTPEDTNIIDKLNLEECLRYWAFKTGQTHAAINLIMEIIRRKTDGKKLPLSARTLLKTSRTETSKILAIPGGQYWYRGLQACLNNCFQNLQKPMSISININIDGLPMYKSSRLQLWPILINIFEMPDLNPMPVAIYCGNNKPSDLDSFLKPFADELDVITSNGLCINGHHQDQMFYLRFTCPFIYKRSSEFQFQKWMFEMYL
ncbi:uncharacterized protein LOC129748738 isoform X2 [Uranotaenia lowii]|uniref:uncharacterized protein LOC129748738 isoform X2 n=1 Tax=Uranotaenia lowii TaxID=190385 RepID=UPI002478D5AB|nr:uncharacterized protein LOC129748738 isoform X2 [Uranotaenia lowii]